MPRYLRAVFHNVKHVLVMCYSRVLTVCYRRVLTVCYRRVLTVCYRRFFNRVIQACSNMCHRRVLTRVPVVCRSRVAYVVILLCDLLGRQTHGVDAVVKLHRPLEVQKGDVTVQVLLPVVLRVDDDFIDRNNLLLTLFIPS